MGAKFRVQKTMAATSRGARDTVATAPLYGFLQETAPERIRCISQSE